MSKNHKTHRNVWAIVRIDDFQLRSVSAVTVKAIVEEEEVALAEVSRLNRVNGGKGCRYVAQMTCLYPPETRWNDRDPTES